jgi:CO dehydrogenase/acetyl-CoA synthase beta subunit
LKLLCACAASHYTPLAGADQDQVEQLKENLYRVEYRVSSFTSQAQLDAYLRRRCAELTLREGYDFFHMSQRADVLALSRRTSITLTMFKTPKPAAAADLYDATEVLAESPTISKSE